MPETIGSIFIVAGAIFLIAAVYDCLLGLFTPWQSVPGTVTRSAVETFAGEGHIHIAKVTYRYSVSGTEYNGTRLGPADWFGTSSRRRATRLLERYPIGSAVTVYVSLRNPTQALLESRAPGRVAGAIVTGLVISAIGFLLAFRP
jgi:hypothetical protein